MVDSTITTGVDDLIEFLKKHNKITLQEAAKELKISAKILQTWVDFLVEEKIVGIEYKFTQPYIYLNRTKEEEKKIEAKTSVETIKKDFFERAKKKNLPEAHIVPLWDKKVDSELNKQKIYFFRYAKARKLTKIDDLWKSFCNKIKMTSSAT